MNQSDQQRDHGVMNLPFGADGYPTLGPGKPLRSMLDGGMLTVAGAGSVQQQWRLDLQQDRLAMVLERDHAPDIQAAYDAMLAALDAAFSHHLGASGASVSVREDLADLLLRQLGRPAAEGRVEVPVDMFWQQDGLWLRGAGAGGYPLQYEMSPNGRRHPRRPPKPVGEVYARHIPWLGRTLSFRVAEMDRDLQCLHRWMNDPRVAEFWQEEGELEHHRRYLENQLADPHTIPLIACADGRPFGYFEVYWAKENRLGPYYDAHDYDRGWHVLIGESSVRGRAWVTAWLPSLMHYLFLDDSRTQRIVGEPRADHRQQINNLDRCGFSKVKEFDFPHKRAMLVMLLRERYFGERLWVPQGGAPLAAE